jgi:hypothetical protein
MSAENSKSWFGWFTPPAMKHWGIMLDVYNKVDNHHFEKMVELTISKETNTVKVKFYDWDDGEEDTWNKKYGGFQKIRIWPDLSKEINSYDEIVYDQNWIDKYVDTFNRQNPNYQVTGNNCQKFVQNFLIDITGESEKIIRWKIHRAGTPVIVNFCLIILITLMVALLWYIDVSCFYLIVFSFTQVLALFYLVYGNDERFLNAGSVVFGVSLLLVCFYITAYTIYCIFMSIYNHWDLWKHS